MYGERIRERREELGLSQLDLAVLLSTSLHNIKAWEKEEKSPSIDELIALSEELCTTIDWLVGISEEDEFDEYDDEYEDELDEDLFEEDLLLDDSVIPITDENFLKELIIPHMKEYRANNKRSVYIHVQFSESPTSEDCIIYAGDTADVFAVLNLLIDNLSNKTGVNYYDIMAMMASAHARTELGIEDE